MVKRVINWLALTQTEQRVILFLAVTLLAGAGIRLYQVSYAPSREFEYHSIDSSFAAFQERLAADSAQDQEGSAARLLDINSATKNELIKLPGIGDVLADRIIRYRQEEGLFGNLGDLQKVKGISKKKLDKLKPLLTIQ